MNWSAGDIVPSTLCTPPSYWLCEGICFHEKRMSLNLESFDWIAIFLTNIPIRLPRTFCGNVLRGKL